MFSFFEISRLIEGQRFTGIQIISSTLLNLTNDLASKAPYLQKKLPLWSKIWPEITTTIRQMMQLCDAIGTEVKEAEEFNPNQRAEKIMQRVNAKTGELWGDLNWSAVTGSVKQYLASLQGQFLKVDPSIQGLPEFKKLLALYDKKLEPLVFQITKSTESNAWDEY